MKYDSIFKEMLNCMDFSLDKYDDGYGLTDLQGANWGDIESDRFNTAVEIIERLEIYLDDYYYNDLCDEANCYFDIETLPNTYNDWLKFMDDHLNFKKDHMHEYEVFDMIVNHIEEINLNEVVCDVEKA